MPKPETISDEHGRPLYRVEVASTVFKKRNVYLPNNELLGWMENGKTFYRGNKLLARTEDHGRIWEHYQTELRQEEEARRKRRQEPDKGHEEHRKEQEESARRTSAVARGCLTTLFAGLFLRPRRDKAEQPDEAYEEAPRKEHKGCRRGCLIVLIIFFSLISVLAIIGLIVSEFHLLPPESPVPQKSSSQPESPPPRPPDEQPAPEPLVIEEPVAPKAIEPDWQERHRFWVYEYSRTFKPPKPGTDMSVTLKSENVLKGKLKSIGNSSLELELDNGAVVGLQNTQVRDDLRPILFSKDYAELKARREVQTEKTKWERDKSK